MAIRVDGRDVDRERIDERYSETFPKWKRKAGKRCPRVIAKKRCLTGSANGELCICERYCNLLDHSELWRTETNDTVLTGEPYSIDLGNLWSLWFACSNLGLSLSLHSYSPYNPGSTFLIMIRVALWYGAEEE